MWLSLSAVFNTYDHSILWNGTWGHCFTVAPVLPGGENSESGAGGLLFDTLAPGMWEYRRVLFCLLCHQYVDDIQLYLSLSPKSEEAVSTLNQCLVSVMDWRRVNKLKLNPDKRCFSSVERQIKK